MYKKLTFRFVTLLVATLALLSCTKAEFKELVTRQESEIESYIAREFEENEVIFNDGVWRVILKHGGGGQSGEGVSAAKGDSLVFNYVASIFRGSPSTIFDTSSYDIGEEIGLGHDASYYVPRRYLLGKGEMIEGLERGLIGVKKGELSLIFFSTKYGYGSLDGTLVPKESALLFEVEIVDVIKK